MLVLIDTWWNVNLGAITIEETKAPVLIDTWWNVNYKTKVTTSKTASGFNRYMVECEFVFYNISVAAVYDFNRYMVECESRRLFDRYILQWSFNRYMVECESRCVGKF